MTFNFHYFYRTGYGVARITAVNFGNPESYEAQHYFWNGASSRFEHHADGTAIGTANSLFNLLDQVWPIPEKVALMSVIGDPNDFTRKLQKEDSMQQDLASQRKLAEKLQSYKSHKIVSAAKITAVNPIEQVGGDHLRSGCELELDCEVVAAFSVDWFNHFKPEVGQYLVIYADGYASVSPAKAFEEGYTRI